MATTKVNMIKSVIQLSASAPASIPVPVDQSFCSCQVAQFNLSHHKSFTRTQIMRCDAWVREEIRGYRCAGTLACLVSKAPSPAPPAAPTPYERTPEDILGSCKVLTPCVLDSEGECINPFECENPLCFHNIDGSVRRTYQKEWAARRRANYAENRRRMIANRRRRAKMARIRVARESLAEELARIQSVKDYFAAQEPYRAVGPRGGAPTSKALPKTKTPSWRFERAPVYGPTTAPLPPPPPRSQTLLARLRALIRELRAIRNKFVAYANYWASIPIAQGEEVEMTTFRTTEEVEQAEEMLEVVKPLFHATTSQSSQGLFRTEMADPELEDATNPSEDKASNVVVQDAAPPVKETVGDKLNDLVRFCETDLTQYEKDLDRWLIYDKFTWTSSHAAGTNLSAKHLPVQALIEKGKWKNNVAANAIRMRQYMNCDMEIKVVLNSSPFNVGQCQVVFYYRDDLDSSFSDRQNNYSFSQNNHVLLDATSSQPAMLYIPFKSFKNYMNVRKRTGSDNNLMLGTLYIKVLNILKVPTSSSVQVDGQVFVRFINTRLMGMVPPFLGSKPCLDEQIVNTEMLPAMATMTAMNLLYQKMAEPNRDNPPLPHYQPHLVPVATNSLAVGTNYIEPVSSLRLDARGQTPHPDFSQDEMLIKNIIRKWGFVKTLTLNNNMMNGTLLDCFDAAPVCNKDFYKTTSKDGSKLYYLPPVAVLASMFGLWRGKIELRLDFIATKYHQARLFVCWVPNWRDKVSLDDAMSLGGVYFDLKEGNRDLVVEVPYISDTPWWPHLYSSGVGADVEGAPSKICIFIVNRLVYTNAVSSNIDVNVYMRGGIDFELAVPIQPTIGLSFNAKTKKPTDVINYAKAGYYPWYVGTWDDIVSGQVAVLRYGPVTQHVAQFEKNDPSSAIYYRFVDVSLAESMKWKADYMPTSLKTGNDCWFVPLSADDGDGSIYMGVCSSLDTVKRYYFIQDSRTKTWTKLKTPDRSQLSNISVAGTSDNTYYYGTSNALLKGTIMPLPTIKLTTEAGDDSGAGTKVTFDGSRKTYVGRGTFGEKIVDLKDLCRRYMVYGHLNLKNSATKLGGMSVSIPILPQGLDLVPELYDESNYLRDGHIPIVLSGFRFYRGSLRFKIISQMESLQNFYIQHKPDRIMTDDHPAFKLTAFDRLYNYGYASSLQVPWINPIDTVEIPYYLPTPFGLLQRPNFDASQQAKRAMSMGALSIGATRLTDFDKTKDVDMVLMYKVADDFRAYCFQGFPPVMFITEAGKDVPTVTEMQEPIRPQYIASLSDASRDIDFHAEVGKVSKFLKETIMPGLTTVKDAACAKYDNIRSDTSRKMLEQIDSEALVTKINEVIAGVDEAKVKEIANAVIKEILADDDIDAILRRSVAMENFCRDFVFGVTLGLIDGDYKYTAAMMFKSICDIFGLNIFLTSGLTFALSKLCAFVGRQQTSTLKTEAGPYEVDDGISILTAIWQAIAITLDIKSSQPKNLVGLSKSLFSSINYQSRGSRGLLTFFKNIIQAIKSMLHYAYGKVLDWKPEHSIVHAEQNVMEKWVNEALELTSPLFREQVIGNESMYIRLDVCYSVGKFLFNALIAGDHVKTSHTFCQLFKKVEELYSEAVNEGIGSQIRQEPISYWFSGPAGAGKSHLMSSFYPEMLEVIGEKKDSHNCYTYTPGWKHWEGYKGKAVFRLDDFGIVNGQLVEEEISVFHRLMSNARFTPESAAIPNKGVSFAPKIAIIGCNSEYPNLNQLMDKDSFYRRRDFLVSFSFVEKFKFKSITADGAIAWVEEQKEKNPDNPYPHVRFTLKDPLENKAYDGLINMEYKTFMATMKTLTRDLYSRKRMTYLQALKFDEKKVIEKGPLDTILESIVKHSIEKHSLIVKDPETCKERILKYYGYAKENIVNMPKAIKELYTGSELPHTESDNPDEPGTSKDAETTEKATEVDSPLLEDNLPRDSRVLDLVYKQVCLLAKRAEEQHREQPLTSRAVPSSVPTTKLPHRFAKLLASRESGQVQFCFHNILWAEQLICNKEEIDEKVKTELKRKCVEDCQLKSESFYIDVIMALGKGHPTIPILLKIAKEMGVFKIYDDFVELADKVKAETKVVYNDLKKKFKGATKFKKIVWLLGGVTMLVGAVCLIDKTCQFGLIFDKYRTGKDKNGKELVMTDKSKVNLLWTRFYGNGQSENQVYGMADHKQAKAPTGVAVKAVEKQDAVVLKAKELSETETLNQHEIRSVEANYETESLRAIVNIVDKNTCYLLVTGVHKNSEKPIVNFQMRCLGILNNWMLLLNHYRIFLEELRIERLYFVNFDATVAKDLVYNKLNFKVFKKSELCLVELPPQIPRFRDIRKHIISQDATKYAPTTFEIFEKSLGHQMEISVVQGRVERDIRYKCDEVLFEIPQAIMYNWHNPGRCMSVVVVKTKSNNKIIGFHIAGGSGTGIAEPVVMETFEPFGDGLVVAPLEGEMFKENGNPAIFLNSHLTSIGVVKDQLAHRPADKSMIRPSIIHGYLPVRTHPNPLTTRDTNYAFSPLVTGVDRHGKPPLGFDTHLLKRAQQELLEQTLLHTIPQRQSVGVLTESAAILGIEGMDGYEGMELSTSEGFPYYATRPRGARNKRYQFEFSIDDEEKRTVQIVDPILRERIDYTLALRKAGIIPMTVFVDCLKDYRNPLLKNLKPGCTRIFSISPTDFTILFRQYFMDFLAATKVCRFTNEHMVGINVNGLEWTKLARILQMKGPKLLCGDYSGFGPSLDPEVVLAVGEVWIQWYKEKGDATEEETIVRRCMIEELRHSFHLVKNLIYQTWCGSPSGAPCTVNINSDVGRMYIYMAWLECWKDVAMMCSFVAMRKHITLFVYGDDLIINVSDFAAERFNNEFLQQFFLKHGLKYTDETKGETIRKWTDISEASFLKNKFIRHPFRYGIYTAGLDKQSIEECANWIQYSGDIIGSSKQTSCDAVMLAYGWGREYFDWFRDRILSAWSEVDADVELTLYTYDEMDWMRFGYAMDDTCGLSLEQLIQKELEWREKNKELMLLAQEVVPIQNLI